MSLGVVLTWLLTFGALAWAAWFTVANARAFGAHPLAGERMSRVAGVYVPLLECGFVLSLVGVAVSSRLRADAPESALNGGLPFLLMLLAVVLPPVAATVVAVQGFTLSERHRSHGDEAAATRLASRGFSVLLVGAASILVTIFAAGLLTRPA